MRVISSFLIFLILLTSTFSKVLLANGNELIGLWQKKGEVVLLEIKEEAGLVSGKIIRADWQPALEGKTILYINDFDQSESRWEALLVNESGEKRAGQIRLLGNNLVITAKGQSRAKWVKTSLDDW